MLLDAENHTGALTSTHADNKMYTEAERPRGRGERGDAMETANKSRTRGIIEMPRAVPDPPRERGGQGGAKAEKERS